jgi:NAD-dependent dihydropyrimidine dehydrogenase PreA subunit
MAVKKYESTDGLITIEVDEELCEGLKDCIEVCPTNVYDLIDGKAVPTRIDECIECCQCVDSCPKNAIKHSSC